MRALLFCCLCAVVTAYSQQAPTTIFPPPVQGASFVYHPPSKALLLIGGSAIIPDSSKSNVWKWNGIKWTEIEAFGPGSRDFFKGGLNTKTGQLNFFAGMNAFQKPQKALWSFDGKKWSKELANDIGTRDHHNMVYMDHLDAFLVYGGNNNGYPHMDSTTWLLKDGKFSALQIPSPGVRYHYGLVYDKYRKKVLLYGGGEKPDEHWEFDGKKWTRITLPESPGRRLYHSMVYNEDSKMVILHGGWVNQNPRDPINSQTPTTWAWDGRTWKKIAEERIFPIAMGYDQHRKVVVAFGRTELSSDSEMGLWELKQEKWTKIATYGKWNTVEYIKQWVQQHPDDALALAKYADILQWQTKQFAEAELVYKKLTKIYPEKTNIFLDLAIVLAMQNKVAEADEYIAKLSQAGLMNRPAYLRLAGLLRMEQKYLPSIKYQEIALKMAPAGVDFYNLASAYARSGNPDRAFDALNKAIENGFNAKGQFENDTDLESLKADTRWKVLLDKLQ